MSCNHSAENKAKLTLLSALLIFGTIGIFVRYIPLPSSVIALGRGIIGTAFLCLFLKIRNISLNWQDIQKNKFYLILSSAALCGNWTFLFEAYRHTSIPTATLSYYMAPIIVILISPFFLREKLTFRKFICVLTASAGMFLVSGASSDTNTGLTGIFFGLCAASCYACLIICNKKLTAMTAYDKTIVQLGISAVLLCPYVMLTETLSAAAVPPFGLFMFFIVGIVHTGLAYVLYFGSIEPLKAQTIALFGYLDPIFAIILSALILNESLEPSGIIGALLVLGSTCFCELKS